MPQHPICGNPLLLQFLEEWQSTAREAGSQSEKVYRKAATSMRNNPLEFDHPMEAVCLAGIGETIAKRLTERLIAYYKDRGQTPPPMVPYMKKKAAPKRATAAKPSHSKAKKMTTKNASDNEMDPEMLAALPNDVRRDLERISARTQPISSSMTAYKPSAQARKPGSPARDNSDNEMHPEMLAALPANIRAAPKPRKRKSAGTVEVEEEARNTDKTTELAAAPAKRLRQTTKKPYVPSRRSGAYAILRALVELDDKVTKDELIRAAQPYCDSSFTMGNNKAAGGVVQYTAWSSVKTLKDNNLITQKGKPARFELTECGREVGESILRVETGKEDTPEVNIEDATGASAISVSRLFASTTTGTTLRAASEILPTNADAMSLNSDDDTMSKLPSIPTARQGLQRADTIQTAPPKFDITTSFMPAYLKAGTFKIYLIIDNREVAAKSDRDYLQRQLTDASCPHITRPLDLGDVMWIAKGYPHDTITKLPISGSEEIELSLDHICERKRLDDLVGSIKDGRFHEQKFRLSKWAGNVTYIIEIPTHSNAIAKQHAYMADAISTAIFSTQVVNNFFVKLSPRLDDTIRYLTRYTRLIDSLFAKKDLYVIPDTHVFPQSYREFRDYLQKTQPEKEYFLTYTALGSLASKSKTMTLRDTFLKMLMCTKGISAEKALEIQRCFQTPRILIEMFRQMEREGKTEEERRKIVMETVDPGAKTDRKRIKASLSSKIYEIWGKT